MYEWKEVVIRMRRKYCIRIVVGNFKDWCFIVIEGIGNGRYGVSSVY